MKTYIINMPAQVLRRKNMSELMQRIGIEDFEFVTPVDKNALPPGFENLSPGYASLNATVSTKIFGMCTHDEPFLIFEDDAIERVHASEILPRIHDILNYLSDVEWDVVYLEYCMEKCQPPGENAKVVTRAYQPYCTAAMLYNPAGIGKVRACLLKEKRLIDFSYARCIKKETLIAYVARPVLFAQDASYGAGDLAHMTPSNVQWWLDIVIRMYPDRGSKSEPRLPACWNSKETLYYVRWGNVALILAGLAVVIYLIVFIVRAKIFYKEKNKEFT